MQINPVFPQFRSALACLALLLAACTEPAGDDQPQAVAAAPAPEPVAAPAPVAVEEAGTCANEGEASYICGPVNAEDLLRLGDSDWVLVSGMSGELAGDASIVGKLHLLHRVERSWEVLFPGPAPVLAPDAQRFPECPGPLDTGNFSVHGLALREQPGAAGRYDLYITSHGAREAIETFTVDTTAGKPTVSWTGCIPMPANSWNNSLVILEDGGFRATQFMDSTNGIERVLAGEITGHVWEWHPGGSVTAIAGTELAGPNGIAMNEDGQTLYVAAFGAQAIVRFDLTVAPAAATAIPVGVTPDNVRWSERGTLLTAGGNTGPDCGAESCEGGWSVWEVDPATLHAQRLGGMPAGTSLGSASSALQLGDELWVGTYGGDRVAILPLP